MLDIMMGRASWGAALMLAICTSSSLIRGRGKEGDAGKRQGPNDTWITFAAARRGLESGGGAAADAAWDGV